jgi:hypothetical protein
MTAQLFESPRMTKLYDRTKGEIPLSEGGANPAVMFTWHFGSPSHDVDQWFPDSQRQLCANTLKFLTLTFGDNRTLLSVNKSNAELSRDIDVKPIPFGSNWKDSGWVPRATEPTS